MRILSNLLLGLLFGVGLVVAGMSDPAKVLNFLDIAAIPGGGWDPSLAFVMGGAVVVAFFGYRWALAQPQPVFAENFMLPPSKRIELRVIVGPALFGIGWGLVGLCPGPAFTALASGQVSAVIFVVAMLAGMVAARLLPTARIATPRLQAEG